MTGGAHPPVALTLNTPSTPSKTPHIATFSPNPSLEFPPSAQTSPRPRPEGLLIPTDRSADELETRWLPKLGRLRIHSEVTVPGFALYAVRSWYLSRTHWSQTIVTQTGKPNESITAYLVVPEVGLSERVGTLEISTATQLLASETKSQPRKTEYGTLLVNTPTAFGQDVFPVAGGDLRQAKPFLLMNTGLRRLGCGGRAAMTLEPPIPALRRKFNEQYRLPPIPSAAPISRQTSPSASPIHAGPNGSPTRNGANSPASASASMLADPCTLMVTEMVNLIQAALALWGMFGAERDELELDGLFCDETKAGIFQWRRVMGMEHEESLKLEKATSGGCIDPKTLSALLSSITSTRYHLAILGVEKLPKDPFSKPFRFLHAWHNYQLTMTKGSQKAEYLTTSSLRSLQEHFASERTRSPADALKVHRLLFSGVASATSSISANLKGGAAEDTPLRKREHHAHRRDSREDAEGGVNLIVPDEDVGSVASPNAITTNLEAFIAGVLKSREKDWDTIGARRIADLWNGHVLMEATRKKPGQVRKHTAQVKGRVTSGGTIKEEEGEESTGGVGGALKGMTARTGQVLNRGIGLVTRRGTAYETSDSEAGPGPSSMRTVLARRKQSTVPTVIEPDLEEVEEHLLDRASLSPSPALSVPQDRFIYGAVSTRPSFLPADSRGTSKRPSIITRFSNDGSEAPSRSIRASSIDVGSSRNYVYGRRSPLQERSDEDFDHRPMHARSVSDRAVAWRERGRATTMLRTASDGADVTVEEGGNEWEVLNPHGTGRGQHVEVWMEDEGLTRRHSLQDRLAYRDVRLVPTEHLAVDVELCSVVLKLRAREAQLARQAENLKMLEQAVFAASQNLIDAIRSRGAHVERLNAKTEALSGKLERVMEDIDEDRSLRNAGEKIKYKMTEGDNDDLYWNLVTLKEQWETVRKENERRRKEAEGLEEKRGWWRFGL